MPYPDPYSVQEDASGPSANQTSESAAQWHGAEEVPYGWQVHEAEAAYAQVRQGVVRAAYRSLAWGLLWLIGGLAITIGTYMSADPGGTYVITWGAVLFGAWKTIAALIRVADPDAAIRKALNDS